MIVYLFPLLMDAVVAAAVFVATLRAAAAGWSASAVAGLCAVAAITYSLASAALSRFLTPANAVRFLRFACLLSALACSLLAAVPALLFLWFLLPLLTVGMALFFAPFQIFMKEREGGQRSLAHSTGLYTFAWSTGYALGPFIAGWLWAWRGWQTTYLADIAACLLTLVLLERNNRMPAPSSAAPQGSAVVASPKSSLPDLAWMAWLAGGLGCLTIAIIRSVFPSTSVQRHLDEAQCGMIFALLSGFQAITGLALTRGRGWMYRPAPLTVFGICGISGLFAFALGNTFRDFLLAAGLYGIYSGSFFFYFVWHSLAHPEKSGRYIAINEAIVGITGVIGPVCGGALADACGMIWPYLASAFLVAAVVVVQWLVHTRIPVLPHEQSDIL
ncbi:MAG: MFS transporter [Planctomycetota bacterium]|nr:MFS transporter [Planctomycetota bacterium]